MDMHTLLGWLCGCVQVFLSLCKSCFLIWQHWNLAHHFLYFVVTWNVNPLHQSQEKHNVNHLYISFQMKIIWYLLVHLITWYQFCLYKLVGCRVRFHYGHPDVFDRIFHITRGGISKASSGINLSEDIFAGNVWSLLCLTLRILFRLLLNLHFLVYRFQFNAKTWEYHTPWIYPSGKGKGCGTQSNFTFWSKSGLW